jgi:dolichol-phosphate mannosyltransferase
MTKPHISIVAPVYNEEAATLTALVERLKAVVGAITPRIQIVLVDDGSRLPTWNAIAALARAHPDVVALRFARNFGQHAAISAGIDHATGDYVVVMDSDLQDRPEVIPQLYEKARAGNDIVFVKRLQRPDSLSTRVSSYLFFKVLNTLAEDVHDGSHGNFSIISRVVADVFRSVPDRDRFYAGTVRWLGFPVAEVEAEHGERFGGRPAYGLRGRLRLARRVIIGYSTRLLHAALFLGAAMALVAFVAALWIVITVLSSPERSVPGWPSVFVSVIFVGGLTNIVLGVIGIYLAELFDWAKGRPRYVVRQRLGGAAEENAPV